MSQYLCVTCNAFYDNIEAMKRCKHEKLIEKNEVRTTEKLVSEQALKEKELEDAQTKVKVNELLRNLDNLLADDVKFITNYLDINYTNKDEAIQAIKTKLGK